MRVGRPLCGGRVKRWQDGEGIISSVAMQLPFTLVGSLLIVFLRFLYERPARLAFVVKQFWEREDKRGCCEVEVIEPI